MPSDIELDRLKELVAAGAQLVEVQAATRSGATQASEDAGRPRARPKQAKAGCRAGRKPARAKIRSREEGANLKAGRLDDADRAGLAAAEMADHGAGHLVRPPRIDRH